MWEYNNTLNSDELYHYGVLGMKWGIRKAKIAEGKRKASHSQRSDLMNAQISKTTKGAAIGALSSSGAAIANKVISELPNVAKYTEAIAKSKSDNLFTAERYSELATKTLTSMLTVNTNVIPYVVAGGAVLGAIGLGLWTAKRVGDHYIDIADDKKVNTKF